MREPAYKQLVPMKVIEQIESLETRHFSSIPGYRRSYLYQIISVVAFSTRKDNEPASLKSEYLKREVPNGLDYVKALIQAGIIVREGKPQLRVTSFKYSIAEAYRDEIERIPLEDMKLVLRIRNRQKQGKGRRRIQEAQTRYIRKMQINPIALDLALSIPDRSKRLAAIAAVTAIENHEYFHKVDSTAGRYHSNLTSINSALRPFITIEGKSLTGVDLKNAQPYLSLLLLTNPAAVAPFARDAKFSMFLETLEPVKSKDVSEYIKLVTTGQLYEVLMEEFAHYGITYSREETKMALMRILYSSNKSRTQEKGVFKGRFPFVFNRFREVRGFRQSASKYQNYRRFAILLQAVEAGLILSKILPRIYTERPGAACVSVHDSVSISTTSENIEYVKQVMKSELFRFTGFIPSLKVEAYDPEILTNPQKALEFFNNTLLNKEKDTTTTLYQYESENLVIN
jgi:hypothetical protein